MNREQLIPLQVAGHRFALFCRQAKPPASACDKAETLTEISRYPIINSKKTAKYFLQAGKSLPPVESGGKCEPVKVGLQAKEFADQSELIAPHNQIRLSAIRFDWLV